MKKAIVDIFYSSARFIVHVSIPLKIFLILHHTIEELKNQRAVFDKKSFHYEGKSIFIWSLHK